MRYEAVFFDFDGVILDSVDVKTKAFAEMFKKFGPAVQQQVVDYHFANGGVSRFDKFRYFYKTFLNKHIDEATVKSFSDEFSKLVVNKVLACDFIEGAMETLIKLKEHNIPAYVVSGTPDFELKGIIEKKRLNYYFNEVHGSPRKKDIITRDILTRQKHLAKKCLFIGDSLSDHNAAIKNKMLFLGIVPERIKSIFPNGTRISAIVDINIES